MSSMERFWDFSVRTYRTKRVPEACLKLQDERGVDVNLLLYCFWYGAARGVLNDQAFREALDFSKTWSTHVVKPIRDVRRWMKVVGCVDDRVPGIACMSLRDKVKATEFEAERIQEDVLETLSGQSIVPDLSYPHQLESALANARKYLTALHVDLGDWETDCLVVILAAALPAATRDEVREALGSGR